MKESVFNSLATYCACDIYPNWDGSCSNDLFCESIFLWSVLFFFWFLFFVSSVWLFIRNHIINLVAKWLKRVWKFRTKKWRIHKCARWCARQNSNSFDRFEVSHICNMQIKSKQAKTSHSRGVDSCSLYYQSSWEITSKSIIGGNHLNEIWDVFLIKSINKKVVKISNEWWSPSMALNIKSIFIVRQFHLFIHICSLISIFLIKTSKSVLLLDFFFAWSARYHTRWADILNI